MQSSAQKVEAIPEVETAASPSLDEYWLPFTPNRDLKAAPRLFARAEGVYYYDPTGRPILDGASGLFAVAAGHGRREIIDAVHRQLEELDYTPSFYRSHPLAFAAAASIAALTPKGLDRIFFVNSGSESVDTAMKIALAYHRARGEGQRTVFVSREYAYHGVNFGGVSLSGMANNRRRFSGVIAPAPLLRHTGKTTAPFHRGQPEEGAERADDLQRVIDAYGAENIAAVVVEPIAGSIGVLIPPVGYLDRLRAICDRHGILLVFDEVITGFGRTGQAFASQTFGVRPDIMTMAKAITNGVQPMGAVAVDRGIHDTIMDAAPEESIEFFHGYTWSAHPGACAACVAALDVYSREGLFERGAGLSGYFREKLYTLADLPVVSDIRQFGLLAGIDFVPESKPGQRGYRLQKQLFDAGLHLKTTGDTGIVAPAFVSTREHIDEMVDVLRRVLEKESL